MSFIDSRQASNGPRIFTSFRVTCPHTLRLRIHLSVRRIITLMLLFLFLDVSSYMSTSSVFTRVSSAKSLSEVFKRPSRFRDCPLRLDIFRDGEA
jgi:hypothetical protein